MIQPVVRSSSSRAKLNICLPLIKGLGALCCLSLLNAVAFHCHCVLSSCAHWGCAGWSRHRPCLAGASPGRRPGERLSGRSRSACSRRCWPGVRTAPGSRWAACAGSSLSGCRARGLATPCHAFAGSCSAALCCGVVRLEVRPGRSCSLACSLLLGNCDTQPWCHLIVAKQHHPELGHAVCATWALFLAAFSTGHTLSHSQVVLQLQDVRERRAKASR